jgi:hypothetical protein
MSPSQQRHSFSSALTNHPLNPRSLENPFSGFLSFFNHQPGVHPPLGLYPDPSTNPCQALAPADVELHTGNAAASVPAPPLSSALHPSFNPAKTCKYGPVPAARVIPGRSYHPPSSRPRQVTSSPNHLNTPACALHDAPPPPTVPMVVGRPAPVPGVAQRRNLPGHQR